MAGISGKQLGNITELFRVAHISSKTISNIETAAVVGNLVKDTEDLGEISNEHDVLEKMIFGTNYVTKIQGMSNPSDFTFSVIEDRSDTTHSSIRDDGGTLYTWILKFTDQVTEANLSYAVFDGITPSANISTPFDDTIMMDVSVARQGPTTWLDKA